MGPRLTYHELDARLYQGRQEGPLHRRVLDGLESAARTDALIDQASVLRERYLPAAVPDFHGRYPDLYLTAQGRAFAFEVQTAPITVHRLIERGQFYEAASIRLVWITWKFDPAVHRNAWYWDVLSADFDTIYSIDEEILAKAAADHAIVLRRFKIRSDGETFDVDTVGLRDLDPHLWAADLRDRWIVSAADRMHPLSVPFAQLADRAEVTVEDADELWALAETVNVLIAIQTGEPVGRRSETVLAQVNAFLNSNYAMLARGIVYQALKWFQPVLYAERDTLAEAINRATERAKKEDPPVVAWTRDSKIGRLRDVLFPEWSLRTINLERDEGRHRQSQIG